MALADLADDIVRLDTDSEPAAVQDERERIYTTLYHCHVPKLADAGLLSFDINEKLVHLREDGNDLPLEVLEATTEAHTQ